MTQRCYVQLGKYGDLLILSPGWLREYQQTGVKPVVMVSKEFSSTLEGMSYVRRWEVPLHWYGDCGEAVKMAEKEFGKDLVVFPKWWDNPGYTPPAIRGQPLMLIIHGKRMGIEKDEWFSYMVSMWKFAGFPVENIHDPVVIDRRRPEAEEALRKHIYRTTKPKILHCLNTGGSSPFGPAPEVERILYSLKADFEIIDLMKFRADRIYDLLGLMEDAALLVVTDTAPMHLAGACNVPYIGFISNGGGGSVTRGNCVYSVRYDKTLENLEEVRSQITTHAYANKGHHVSVQRAVSAAVLPQPLLVG